MDKVGILSKIEAHEIEEGRCKENHAPEFPEVQCLEDLDLGKVRPVRFYNDSSLINFRLKQSWSHFNEKLVIFAANKLLGRLNNCSVLNVMVD